MIPLIFLHMLFSYQITNITQSLQTLSDFGKAEIKDGTLYFEGKELKVGLLYYIYTADDEVIIFKYHTSKKIADEAEVVKRKDKDVYSKYRELYDV